MAVPGFVKLLMVFVVFDWSEGEEICDRSMFVPEFADHVKSLDLKVQYGTREVKCGETFGALDGLKAPNVTYDLGNCRYATILAIATGLHDPLLDPQLLYLVHNVPGSTFKHGFKGKNQDGPLEPDGSNEGNYGAKWVLPKLAVGDIGLHNVLFFLYCQCQYIDPKKIENIVLLDKRRHFPVKKYAKEKKLGNPVAVTYNRYEAEDAVGIS